MTAEPLARVVVESEVFARVSHNSLLFAPARSPIPLVRLVLAPDRLHALGMTEPPGKPRGSGAAGRCQSSTNGPPRRANPQHMRMIPALFRAGQNGGLSCPQVDLTVFSPLGRRPNISVSVKAFCIATGKYGA